MDAATQIFYSLSIGFGALIAFSSYMPRKNNCVNDALIVVLINCGTSLFAGIVTFSFLGYRQHKTGIAIGKVCQTFFIIYVYTVNLELSLFIMRQIQNVPKVEHFMFLKRRTCIDLLQGLCRF